MSKRTVWYFILIVLIILDFILIYLYIKLNKQPISPTASPPPVIAPQEFQVYKETEMFDYQVISVADQDTPKSVILQKTSGLLETLTLPDGPNVQIFAGRPPAKTTPASFSDLAVGQVVSLKISHSDDTVWVYIW